MPAAIVSIVATDDDVLGGVTAVTLTDRDGTYGIRNKHTHDVAVPAGTPLENTSQGVWEYLLDRDDDQIYEAALAIEYSSSVLRVNQDVFAAAAPAADSESDSDSADAIVRHVDLVPSPVTRVFDPQLGELLSLVLTCENEVLMPRHILTCQQRPDDPYSGTPGDEDFLFVATPFDVTFYPLDKDPEQIPGFYRKDTITVRAASSEVLIEVINRIQADVTGLIANYNRLDHLYPTAEVILDGTGDIEDMLLDPLPELPEPTAECPAVAEDDQIAFYDELANALGDTVSMSEV